MKTLSVICATVILSALSGNAARAQAVSLPPGVTSAAQIKKWTPNHAAKDPVPETQYTADQMQKIESAKAVANQLRAKENARTSRQHFPDPKQAKVGILVPASTSGIQPLVTFATYRPVQLASVSGTDRAGIFMITLQDSSSSSSSWPGGHSAMVYNSMYTIESWGNNGNNNGVNYWSNDWEIRYAHLTSRTVNTTTLQQDQDAATYASNQVGKPYNYNFFYVNQDGSFYCSQLVWKAFWQVAGVDLGYGMGPVWPSDLQNSTAASDVYTQ